MLSNMLTPWWLGVIFIPAWQEAVALVAEWVANTGAAVFAFGLGTRMMRGPFEVGILQRGPLTLDHSLICSLQAHQPGLLVILTALAAPEMSTLVSSLAVRMPQVQVAVIQHSVVSSRACFGKHDRSSYLCSLLHRQQ